ncbi:hypothetical protein O0L34_g13914 [Tuta absoluta]|nr:hypothetical protein O0L34_g13914 [Tuta absoluta]
MALKVENEADLNLQESSLDNSADGELLGMVDEGSFGSGDHHFLEAKDGVGTSYLRDLSGAVTYKIVQMGDDPIAASMSSHSPTHGAEFYVIGEPMEVYSAGSPVQKQTKVIRKTPIAAQPPKQVTAKKRDDRRRATHNEVERRRRDKINSWITKLAALVPNSGLPDTASKGGILAKACDHITELTEKGKRLEKLEMDNEKLVLEILRLNRELTELRKENTSMRSQLADNCIVTTTHRPKGQKS